jgi:general secretion pathway protein A
MYESHFRLTGRPFRAGPDPISYYPSTAHEEALARLLRAIREDESFSLLTGVPGTGKTLLLQVLAERLGPEAACAFLVNSHVPDRAGLLQALLFDLALPYESRGEQELRLTLTDYLLKQHAAGQRTVLMVDEAQHLGPDLLEELRLLGNLEGGSGKAVQMVLAGQPPLTDVLQRPELAGFRQRVAVRVRVEPLGLHEAADYVVHQVRVAGGRPNQMFTDEALEILARATQGIPRLLNHAAHQALSLAYGVGAPAVDAEAALEALALLGLDAESAEPAESGLPRMSGEEASGSLTADVSAGEGEPERPGKEDPATIEWKPSNGRPA